jgi:hypothetical protein
MMRKDDLMATFSLEDRVKRLEAFVANLSASTKRGKKKDWRQTLGMFTGDEIMKRIDEQALKYRKQDRKRTRRPRLSARLAKP